MTIRSLDDLFVDRLEEIRKFRSSLEGTSGRRIILVTAGPGMGKSWLLRRFAQEAEARGHARALIDFSDGQAYDVLTLVRRFRDLIDPVAFNRLTATINEATAPRLVIAEQAGPDPAVPTVSLAGAQAGDVSIGDVAGGSIVKDNFFVVQTDNPLLLQAIEDRVTLVFFECLAEVVAAGRTVLLLFDSYERTSQEADRWVSNAADRWLQRELLLRIRDGRLPGVVVVLAGRRVPPFDAEWARVVGRLPLDLFTLDDVAEYLRRNRRLPSLTDAEVQTLYNAVQGNPQLLGIIGDNLERSTATGAPDDDW
ncbi:MAG TPA: hypothetical protein PKD53_24285 [Chloroflexaceae bacterium]|nr:hypothetical protein [Chloroflexaceae bacterium]